MAQCTRHRRGTLIGWMPVDARSGRVWAIAEVYRCARCGQDMQPRLARGTVRRTQRAAMEAYGLPAETVDAFFPPVQEGSAVAVPLTRWPFPVSTRYPRQEA